MRLPSPVPLSLLVAQRTFYITQGLADLPKLWCRGGLRKLASLEARNKSGRVSFLEKEEAHRVNFPLDLLNGDGSFS